GEALRRAEPGSGLQLSWARAYAAAARDDADLATLRGWLDADGVPEGLGIDTGLRWHLVQSLVAVGGLPASAIDAELERDSTASGRVEAMHARALIPTAEAKAEAWRRLTEDTELPNSQRRALAQGFQHSTQVALTAPYAEKYFAAVGEIWANWDGDVAQGFAVLLYPAYQVSPETIAMTDAWLADQSHPAPLRRLVGEGRDGVVRALAARARDSAAG
ncbi:MAG: ERAP1-like C-terminal domain-containing protein, partial [Micromonosporaceae bacterium]